MREKIAARALERLKEKQNQKKRMFTLAQDLTNIQNQKVVENTDFRSK